jgi:hypothetical protein
MPAFSKGFPAQGHDFGQFRTKRGPNSSGSARNLFLQGGVDDRPRGLKRRLYTHFRRI